VWALSAHRLGPNVPYYVIITGPNHCHKYNTRRFTNHFLPDLQVTLGITTQLKLLAKLLLSFYLFSVLLTVKQAAGNTFEMLRKYLVIFS